MFAISRAVKAAACAVVLATGLSVASLAAGPPRRRGPPRLAGCPAASYGARFYAPGAGKTVALTCPRSSASSATTATVS